MRIGGRDARSIHPAVRIAKEHAPEVSRSPVTLETGRGVRYAYAAEETGELHTELNIAAQSRAEAMDALLAIRAWARGNGELVTIEPTAMPGKCYEGMLQSVGTPELTRGFGTVEVVHYLPSTDLMSVAQRKAEQTAGVTLRFRVVGTVPARFAVAVTPQETKSAIRLDMDGETFYRHKEQVAGGATLRVDMHTNEVTLDGEDAAAGTDYLQTDFDVQLEPGWHELTCSATAAIEVRWHDRWA